MFIRPLEGTSCPFDTDCLCGPCNYELHDTVPHVRGKRETHCFHHTDFYFRFNQGRLCVHYDYDIIPGKHISTVMRNSIPFPREEFELRIRPFSNGYARYMAHDEEAFQRYLEAVLYCNHWPPE